MQNPAPASLRKLMRAFGRRIADDRGAVMLEFVLVSPILCYLIASILFFRVQLDYAQDQIVKGRQVSWTKLLPGKALTETGPNSDDAKFFTIPLRPALMTSALAGAAGNTGALLAIARYLGGTGTGTPYDTLALKRNNYFDQYTEPDAVPVEPWSNMMGGFGQWFGAKIGTGDPYVPGGLKDDGWKDKFPAAGNPWMRAYSTELDPSAYSIPFLSFLNMGLVWNVIDTINVFRTPLRRMDDRDDKDVGEDADSDWPGTFGFRYSLVFFLNGDCEALKLKNSSGSLLDIVE